MTRICPSCNAKLGSYDNYFCSSCGNALPVTEVNTKVSFRRVITVDAEPGRAGLLLHSVLLSLKKVGEITRANEILPWVVILGIAVVPLYYWLQTMGVLKYFERSSPQTSEKPVSGTYQDSSNSVTLNLGLKTGIFSTEKLSEYVPENVDVYIEAHDLPKLGNAFVSYDPAYKNLLAVVEPHASVNFAVFGRTVNNTMKWSVVVLLKDADLKIEDLGLKDYPWLAGEIVNNALILSTDAGILKDAKDAQAKVGKSLALNSQFTSAKGKLSAQGQVSVVVLSDKGATALKDAAPLNLPEPLNRIIFSFIKMRQNSLVVL